ncbi:MAG: rhodanese-like domain-containing protein [Candidatus Hermodarchaeota archaeon]
MKLIKSKERLFIFTITFFLAIFILIPLPTVKAQSYINISVETAHDMINNSTQYPNLVILDVREQWEYDEHHLCNSILIPLSEINNRISELEPYKDTEIIVYCRSGSRSAQASQNLVDNHNFTKIYNMLGGINAWITAGYEVCNVQPLPFILFSDKPFLLIFIITTIAIAFYFNKKLRIK